VGLIFSQPIGVFDSGLGGLTVLKALMIAFPYEDFIYLGDTARIPYGSKSSTTIARYTEKNIRFLQSRNVKAVVVACNSASSVLPQVQTDALVYNVIEPGALVAATMTENKRIGVIATRATVLQKAYVQALEKIDREFQVYQQACPLLVPLVEEGWEEDPLTNLVVYRYLTPLISVQIDTLILGCTHYPVLTGAIRKAVGNGVRLVDSATAIVDLLKKDFSSGKLAPRTPESTGTLHLLATDVSDAFQAQAARILSPLPVPALEVVDIH
jgi:glutamate racemase